MRYTTALTLFLGALSCSTQDSGPTLTGSVTGVYVAPAGAPNPGEIVVGGTEAGTIRVIISYGMPIYMRSSKQAGDVSSLATGDRVIMHYEGVADVKVYPPVWPVTDIEIDK